MSSFQQSSAIEGNQQGGSDATMMVQCQTTMGVRLMTCCSDKRSMQSLMTSVQLCKRNKCACFPKLISSIVALNMWSFKQNKLVELARKPEDGFDGSSITTREMPMQFVALNMWTLIDGTREIPMQLVALNMCPLIDSERAVTKGHLTAQCQ